MPHLGRCCLIVGLILIWFVNSNMISGEWITILCVAFLFVFSVTLILIPGLGSLFFSFLTTPKQTNKQTNKNRELSV